MSVKSVQDVAFGGSFRITSILYSQTEYNRVSEYGVDELLRGETYVREKSVHIHGKGEGVVVGLRYRGIAHPVRTEKEGEKFDQLPALVFLLWNWEPCKQRERKKERRSWVSFSSLLGKLKKKIENLLKKFIASNIN